MNNGLLRMAGEYTGLDLVFQLIIKKKMRRAVQKITFNTIHIKPHIKNADRSTYLSINFDEF